MKREYPCPLPELENEGLMTYRVAGAEVCVWM